MQLIKGREQVVKKISSIVEYKDIYNPLTNKIKITEVIKDGNSVHIDAIVKMVKKVAIAVKDYRIDSKMLETVALLHDIGKKQPRLTVGETVDVKIFEPGEMHAHRSAELCLNFIHADSIVCETVQKLIKNHHTSEEYWTDFSEDERIHCRLFKLFDCLSAGVTRRQSEIKFSYLGNGKLVVKENSNDTRYNGTFELNFFEKENLNTIAN